MTLNDIASRLEFALVGDGSIEVSTLKYSSEADEHSLAVAFSEKDALTTSARAVLTTPRFLKCDKTFIFCNFGWIDAAMKAVARLMIDAGFYFDYAKPFSQVERDGAMFGKGVSIGKGSSIAPFVSVGENVIIGRNCKIESGVVIGSGTQIGDNVIVRAGAKIGVNCHYHFPQGWWQKSFCGVGRLVIGNGVEIGANTVIQRGTLSDTVVGDGTIIGNLVEIAHDVRIGRGCLIVSQVGICGNVTIGDRVEIYGQAGVANWVEIENDAVVFAKSAVTKNVRAGHQVSGLFARSHVEELRRLAAFRKMTNAAAR